VAVLKGSGLLFSISGGSKIGYVEEMGGNRNYRKGG
jgi:hypothetical protein